MKSDGSRAYVDGNPARRDCSFRDVRFNGRRSDSCAAISNLLESHLFSSFFAIPMKSITLVLLLSVTNPAFAQISVDSTRTAGPSDSLSLNVIYPDADTLVTPDGKQRIAANTLPTARAFINGAEARVYRSGVFVGLVSLDVGPNPLRLSVVGPRGDSLTRQFVLMRSAPAKNTPREPVQFDQILMEPSEDLWLGSGDVLEVRFKGSPGYEPTFEIDGVESGIPMRELPVKEAGGFEGVYVGRYTIKPGDKSDAAPVKFKIRKSFWSSEKAYSPGKVTIVPTKIARVIELRGTRPFLNVGLGTDRLGGAKLGYLQPGIRMVVTGKVGRQYKVRLAESHDAWLPSEYANLLPEGTMAPRSLVGSITATGNDREDVVTVGLSQRLAFSSEEQVNPTAVVVDIYGATSNTNWITHHLSASGIQSISWDQVSDGLYRLTILLKGQVHWGYDVAYDNGSNLRIRIRRPPVIASPDSALKGMKIAVDAGHGGDNLGAIGATGVREMDLNLSIAGHVAQLLQDRGATVVMTRKDTTGYSMTERADIILASNAQLLVSIHCNSIGFTTDPEKTRGTATFYRYIGFKPLADIVYSKNLELGLDQFGVVGSFNFSLSGLTQLPNVLVESAFVSNPEDEIKLTDDGFRTQLAGKIVAGVEQFFRMYGAVPQVTGKVNGDRKQ